MRTARFLLRSAFAGVAAVFLILALVGCQSAQPTYTSALVSPKGVKAELFMPKNVLAVVKFGTDNSTQQENLISILGNFPQGDAQKLVGEALAQMNQELAADHMSFENDILPIFGDHFQVLMSLSGNVTKDSQPRTVFVATVGDAQKAQLLFNKEVEKQMMNTQSYKSTTIYQMANTEAFFMFSQDVVVMTNSMAQMQQAIDASGSPEGTLLENVSYQKALGSVQGSLGFFFLDMTRLYADFQNAGTEQGTQSVLDMSLLSKMDGEILGLYAEPDGFRVKGLIYGKDGMMDTFPNPLSPVYLDKEIPGDGVIFYTEGFNLKKILEMEGQIYHNMQGFDQAMTTVSQGFAAIGLDPEKDVLSFMDKGMAFYLRDNGFMMPSLAGLIDASSNVTGAKKTVKALDQIVSQLMPKIQADPTFGPAVTHEQSTGTYRLTLHLDKLPEQEKKMLGDLASFVPVFRYGVSANNIFYVGLDLQSYDDLGGVKLHDSKEYQTALKHIAGYDAGVTYLSVPSAVTYFERLVKFADTYGTPVSPQDMQQYDHIKEYLTPVHSLIFGSKKVSSGSAEINGFLEIGPAK